VVADATSFPEAVWRSVAKAAQHVHDAVPDAGVAEADRTHPDRVDDRIRHASEQYQVEQVTVLPVLGRSVNQSINQSNKTLMKIDIPRATSTMYTVYTIHRSKHKNKSISIDKLRGLYINV